MTERDVVELRLRMANLEQYVQQQHKLVTDQTAFIKELVQHCGLLERAVRELGDAHNKLMIEAGAMFAAQMRMYDRYGVLDNEELDKERQSWIAIGDQILAAKKEAAAHENTTEGEWVRKDPVLDEEFEQFMESWYAGEDSEEDPK